MTQHAAPGHPDDHVIAIELDGREQPAELELLHDDLVIRSDDGHTIVIDAHELLTHVQQLHGDTHTGGLRHAA